jgi:hypothetical protein
MWTAPLEPAPLEPSPEPEPLEPEAITTVAEFTSGYVTRRLKPVQDEVAALRTALAELRGQVSALLAVVAAREPRSRHDA